MKFDTHLHSCHSGDAISEPRTMVKAFKRMKMGFALTDHGTTKGWKETGALAKKEKVPFIQGEEVMVFEGKQPVGELIGLFLHSQIRHSQLWEVIDELKAQDALIVVAHPFDQLRNHFRKIDSVAKKVDAIEGFNSRCVFDLSNRQAQEYARKNGLAVTGSSDAHTPEELGMAWTEVSGSAPEDFRRAVKKGKTRIGGSTSNLIVHIYTALAKQGILKPR